MAQVFRKRGQPAVLKAEAEGLQALAATHTIRVPQVLELEEGRGQLSLEWLDLATPDAAFGERFGHALAALHLHPCLPGYGWTSDNFIGATPQVNTPSHDWLDFWRESRIRPMLARLTARGCPAQLAPAVEHVMETMPALFDDGYQPRPSLVHGDLWSGNWGMLADGTPVIFDPCVSYSDREAELAMMELFGSPPASFWRAYQQTAGLHPGYARRRPLYQLYHLLNHALLFGGSYLAQALECARGCLRR
ncbi:fructosamine kinase family protein [Ramlibacter solisilvae]|uniref:fructosamine kinase family protein n=1 Tax=Ramlibacter tataouinensis TaxID=94132 RepID=UPI000777DCA7|nr:fructosamine kinase family protein [Ramlibacter tataouinensis]